MKVNEGSKRKSGPMTVRITRFTGVGPVTVSGGQAAAMCANVEVRSGGNDRRRPRHLRLIRGGD